MGCDITLNSQGDTTVSTNGCESGIQFFIGQDILQHVAEGEVIVRGDGTAEGRVAYTSTADPPNNGAGDCIFQVQDQINEPYYTQVLQADRNCRSFALIIDEATLYSKGNKVHLGLTGNQVGVTLGSTVSIAPDAVNAQSATQDDSLSYPAWSVIVGVILLIIALLAGGSFLIYKFK